MDNIVLIAAMMGAFIGCLGYFYAKAANGLFLLSLAMIGYGAVMQMKETGEIHELSTGLGETAIGELGRKAGWTFEIFERLDSDVQLAIWVFIGSFFVARILSGIARAKTPMKKESQRKRRKRVFKSFGIKNMADLRRRY